MVGMPDHPRVLVVDDEEDFATALVNRLARRGCVASAVFSGSAALAEMQRTSVDVVVLDLKMPQMDGLTVLCELRKLDPTIEVIVLTGHADVNAGVAGMRLGATDFLQKPVPIQALCNAIEAAAERSRERRREGPRNERRPT